MPKRCPKISIIMAAYNSARFIKKSIDSILKQTFKDFELVVVNDGSQDNTKDVIKAYKDKRIVYLENKRNMGVPKTRNKGLGAARGEYIAYCDHDDIYYPSHLESLARALDSRPECGLAYGRFIVSRPQRPNQIRPASRFCKEALEVKNTVGPPLNIMHRKECLKETGGFDESHTITKYDSEDHLLLLLLSDHFRFFYVNEILGEYRYHDANRCLKLDPSHSYEYITRRRIKRYLRDNALPEYINSCAIGVVNELISFRKTAYAGEISRYFFKTIKNYQTYACLGMRALAKGSFKEARRLLEESIKRIPREQKTQNLRQKEDISTINLYLARAHYHLGKNRSAIGICKKVLRLCPKNLDAKIQLSLAYLKAEDPAKAFGIIKDIKHVPEISHLRGCCYFKNKDLPMAIKEFKAAAEASPKIKLYRDNLKHACLVLKNKPKVSIILCTYNRAGILGKAIKSILNQRFKDFELLIIDDGSRDRTERMVKSHSDRRIVYLKRRHRGLPYCRNAGLRIAQGRYIAYCDDDSVLYPKHLKILSSYLDCHPDIGLVYSDGLVFMPREKPVLKSIAFDRRRLETGNFLMAFNIMHRKECADRSGGFDEKLLSSNDWDMWLKVSSAYKIHHLSRITGEHHYYDGAECTLIASKQKADARQRVIAKRVNLYRKNKKLAEYINGSSIGVILNLLSAGNLNYASSLSGYFLKTTDSHQAVACKGLCSLAKGDFQNAALTLNKAINTLPRDWRKLDAWQLENISHIKSYLGSAYYNLKKTALAKKNCEEALEIFPDNAGAAGGLARCLIKEGKAGEALGLLRKHPYDAVIYNLRGACYLGEKDYENAIRSFKNALILSPRSKAFRHNLSLARLKAKKKK